MSVFSVTIIITAVLFLKDELLSMRCRRQLREAHEEAKRSRREYEEAYGVNELPQMLQEGKKKGLPMGRNVGKR